MAEIKDSGSRREFASGAVRDVAEGKGRCDLLPLDVVASFIGSYHLSSGPVHCPVDEVIDFINMYVRKGDTSNLLIAIKKFCDREGTHPCTAILEVAKHYEDGLQKYPERNWEKGLSLKCYIDSGVRHYLKHMRGDRDEPHDRAFVWNMLGAIWTHRNRPECIDLPFNEDNKTPDTSADYSERIEARAKVHRETSFV